MTVWQTFFYVILILILILIIKIHDLVKNYDANQKTKRLEFNRNIFKCRL